MTCEEEIRQILRAADERNLNEYVTTGSVIRELAAAFAQRIDRLQTNTSAIDKCLSGIACELYDAKVELGLIDPDD